MKAENLQFSPFDYGCQNGMTIAFIVNRFCRFFYWGFYVAFNTVQVISRRVVGRAEETSTYSWSRFCTVNCRPTVSNYQLSHLEAVPGTEPRPQRWEASVTTLPDSVEYPKW